MRKSLIVAALCALPGSLAAQDQTAAWGQIINAHQQQVTNCQAQYAAHSLKTHVAEANCSNAGFYEALANAGFPYLDVIQTALARRLEIAEAQDQKRLTQIQADAQLAELGTWATNEMQGRFLAEVKAQAQQQQQVAQADLAKRQHQYCVGMAMMLPTRTGSFGESLAQAELTCSGYHLPTPPPVVVQPTSPTQTNCQIIYNNVYCQSQ